MIETDRSFLIPDSNPTEPEVLKIMPDVGVKPPRLSLMPDVGFTEDVGGIPHNPWDKKLETPAPTFTFSQMASFLRALATHGEGQQPEDVE